MVRSGSGDICRISAQQGNIRIAYGIETLVWPGCGGKARLQVCTDASDLQDPSAVKHRAEHVIGRAGMIPSNSRPGCVIEACRLGALGRVRNFGAQPGFVSDARLRPELDEHQPFIRLKAFQRQQVYVSMFGKHKRYRGDREYRDRTDACQPNRTSHWKDPSSVARVVSPRFAPRFRATATSRYGQLFQRNVFARFNFAFLVLTARLFSTWSVVKFGASRIV